MVVSTGEGLERDRYGGGGRAGEEKEIVEQGLGGSGRGRKRVCGGGAVIEGEWPLSTGRAWRGWGTMGRAAARG